MEAKDVRNLPWKEVEDWPALSKTAVERNFLGDPINFLVSKTDMDAFVSNVFHDIARKLKIPFEDLKPILESENKPFYVLQDSVYKICYGLGSNNSTLRSLQKTLRIPDVSALNQIDSTDKVGACVKQFEELSDLEKVIFLERIGKVSVKVKTCAKDVPEITEN